MKNAAKDNLQQKPFDYLSKKTELVNKKLEFLAQKHLSTRACNLLKNYHVSYKSLVILFGKELKDYFVLCPGAKLQKTLADIQEFNETIFKPEYMQLKDIPLDEVLPVLFKMDYDFLDDEDIRFVVSFYEKYKYVPAFYILRKRLKTTEEKEFKIFSDYFGISDGKYYSQQELAKKYSLTTERCRQIVTKHQTLAALDLEFNQVTLDYYRHLNTNNYLTYKNREITRIISREHLSKSYKQFAALCQFFSDLKVNVIGSHYPIMVLAKESFIKRISFGYALREMERIVVMKQSKDYYLPIEDLFPGIEEDIKEETLGLFAFVVETRYNLKTTEDHKVIFSANCINPGEVIIDILKNNGKPMSINDIFIEFKKRHPKHKYKYPKRLRSWMIRKPEIRSLGMTSIYALTEWDNLFFGNIKELLIKILSENGKPMSLDEIMPKVLEIFPKTNRLSICNTLKFDILKRFTVIEDDKFYLSELYLSQNK